MDPENNYPPLTTQNEDVFLGIQDGYLSPVRRFFTLLAVFDFLFTVLLWTLCVILIKAPNQSIPQALEDQVLHYTLYNSIFDVVMCAGSRFTILFLFYALLRCHHWFPVAFTTTATCCFLLAKVFLFDWNAVAQTYPVMLILTSFILSWSEAWFLDFRVVPQERQAAMYFSRQNQSYGGSRGVIPWLGQSSVSQLVRGTPVSHSYPESISNFYSPLESPIPSDGENEYSETESMEKKLLSKTRGDTPEAKLWLQQGPVIAEELLNRIHSSGWVLEKSSQFGDNVFYQKTHHKIFMISGILPVGVEAVVQELFHRFEFMSEWNPNVIQCQILQKIDSVTDVSYQVSKSGGPISSRDFVTLRHHKTKPDGTHIIAAVSVKHNLKPNQPKLTRGTNGVSGWVINPSSGQPSRTEFQWLLDVDLRMNGFVPRGVIDSAMVKAALETISCFRRQLEFVQVSPGTSTSEVQAGSSSSRH